MPLTDVTGILSEVPEQIGPSGVKVGSTFGLTTIVMVSAKPQNPRSGVKV